jgi:hypothetical protein
MIEGGGVRTVHELADWVGIGGFGPLLVGGPSTVADLLQEWVEETDVDGFNLTYAVAHETFADIVEHLVPELQVAAPTSATTPPERCARNSSAAALASPTTTPPPIIGISPLHRFERGFATRRSLHNLLRSDQE